MNWNRRRILTPRIERQKSDMLFQESCHKYGGHLFGETLMSSPGLSLQPAQAASGVSTNLPELGRLGLGQDSEKSYFLLLSFWFFLLLLLFVLFCLFC